MRRPEMTISSPVCGLRPLRGRFSFTTKLPKPEILTFSPRSRRRFTISKIDSTTSVASFFEKPTFSYMRSTISAFVMVMAQGLLGVCRGNHGERGERAGERERQAQRCAAGGRSEQPSGSAAIAALPRIVRRSRHDYRDSLLRLLFLQLPLPVEHTRLGALRLGLGHHAGRLVEARQAGVREDVVGRELAELLPRLDCLLVPPELVERHGEPVPAVDVAWVEGERLPVFGDRLLELALAEEIDRLVVEVLLAGHCGSVAHSRAPRQARKRGGRAPPSVVWDVRMPLEADLAAALETAGRGAPPPDFAAWALRVFAYQFERNAPYHAFCERRGVTPATVARWEDVPAVPSAAFRRVELACGPPEAVFRTSGTSGAGVRGRHLVPCLALYRASALATFAPFVLPDAARLPCLCLT